MTRSYRILITFTEIFSKSF